MTWVGELKVFVHLGFSDRPEEVLIYPPTIFF